MPIFEFKCQDCGRVFEEFFAPGESREDLKCPACVSANVKKLLSACVTKVSGAAAGASCGIAPGST